MSPVNLANAINREALLARANQGLSARPRPFVRWAGSKRALLGEIAQALPSTFGRYFEPFLGSGALFFLVEPRHALLSDSCRELIDTYCAVRDNPSAVLRYARDWRPDPDYYYWLRKHRSQGRLKRAAEFLYLNRMCWNGLYRVNAKGEFNVPYGRPKTDYPLDSRNLHSCASALRATSVDLKHLDFETALEGAREGDLAFLDPPYVTGHNNNGFIDYNKVLFSWDDQIRLAARAEAMVADGVNVVVTNAAHDDVVALYPSFEIKIIKRSSSIAADSQKRRRVSEALMWAQHG